jgi:hypothetical protein
MSEWYNLAWRVKGINDFNAVEKATRESPSRLVRRYLAPVTRQITFPTSSATSSEPSGPIATPTGRP